MCGIFGIYDHPEAANLTYLLDYGSHEYVLRRPPLGPVAKSAHDMGREYKVLSVLHQALSFAPRAFLYCDDPALIGADFFVMERRKGLALGADGFIAKPFELKELREELRRLVPDIAEGDDA